MNQDIKIFLKKFFPYFKDYKIQFVISIIGMIMAAVGTALVAYMIKPVLDEIFVDKNETLLYILPFVLVLVFAIKSIGKYLQIYYASYIGLDIVRRLRDEMLVKILTFEMEFFHKMRSGELISRSVNDVERIKMVVSNMIPHFARELLTIVILIGYIFYLNPKMAFLSLIFLPVAFKPLSILAKKMKALSFSIQEKLSDLTARLSEIFNNIEMVKANGVENYEATLFKEENEKINRISRKAVRTSELVSPMMETLGGLAAATIIFIGGLEVVRGDMSVGSFFSFLTALFMLYTPVKTVSTLYNKIQDAVAASERIFSILERESRVKDFSKSLDEDIFSIDFNHVFLKYDDKDALKDISFSAKKGEKIALVGNSGGGKSSIVNLLLRFYDTNSGEILFDGVNIAEVSLKSLRNKISIVTQRVYILNDTVAHNVSYGLKVDRDKVVDALKRANAWEFVKELEDGIDTIIDEFGVNLSGGQRQRIAIARSIYRDPKILIFDEATSALDTESEKRIVEALENISKDKITFIIAHRLNTIKEADKIIVLQDGEIVCSGKYDDLLKECIEFQRLVGKEE